MHKLPELNTVGNKIPNRQAICDTLMAAAADDRNVVALCSDSRGSASMTPFFNAFPQQSIEVGIAEQNLVSISAGLAKCGKKPYAFSPACFLSTRSYEQAKIDCAYSDTNVKLIGISGGVSYGALGMSHHSAQDIAAFSAIPNMRVYLPSDQHQTAKLIRALLTDQKCAYVRVGRNPVEDIYSAENCPFEMDKATVLCDTENPDAAIVACGEMVRPAIEAAKALAASGIHAAVVDMYCVKPFDTEAILKLAPTVKGYVTVEEHAPFGGLGSMVSQAVAAACPKRVVNLALPDAPVITGTSKEVFDTYGLNAEGIRQAVRSLFA
ncbi:MAG: transketolase family protein [Firmicutes bacterium]|nr:transketolase family protein [Bacillota bacterium]